METVHSYKNSALFELLSPESPGGNISECLTCGICNSRCSWYAEQGGPVPRRMVRMALLGLEDLLAKSPMLWNCHLCNRCTLECPMGIDMERVVRKARSLPNTMDMVPKDLIKGIETRLMVGDVNGLTKDEFVETIEWLSEEFADEIDDPEAHIPYDQENTRFLYLPNPRELGMNLLHLTAMAGLFHAFGESWTMSSRHTDVTNWGYFKGDDETTRKMALQIVEATEDLGAETLVLSECGHGFYVLKTLMEKLIGRSPGFSVTSMPELVLEMMEKGVIEFDPNTHPYPIAYHDSCNFGRKSGIFDVPRKLLSKCCQEVVELDPNRLHSICCGGGGGIIQDSTSTKRRMLAGKAKAEQMKVVGLKHIATTCLSCHRQLTELSKRYNLSMQVHTVAALAAEARVKK
jgi:Fe-S oxidoreductase